MGTLVVLYALTETQERVARLMFAGYSIAEIARECGRSAGAVKNTRAAIYRKTRTNSEAGLVKAAFEAWIAERDA